MRGARSILILAAVTAIVVGAVLSVDRESSTAARSGEIVFPGLLDQVNSVARVRVTGKEGMFTLTRDGDTWVIEEKERYAADPDRVHKLLLGAAGMTRVEPKTSNPELYPKLWLEDPSGEDAKSVRYVLEDTSSAVLADWVLGDRRPSKSDASRTELYIRVGDDPLAWLVESSVPGGNTIIDWLDRMVARIDRERLRSAEVLHADGTAIAVSKSLPTDIDFSLQDLPEGREVDSQYRINDIGRFLEDLRFEDVAPSSSLDFSESLDKRMQITTFDGLRIHLETVMRDGDAWAKLRAELDEGLIERAEDGAEEAGEGAEEAGEGAEEAGEGAEEAGEGAEGVGDEAGAKPTDGTGTESKDDGSTERNGVAGALRSVDDVRAEAEELNARWAGWAYELPSFKRDYIAKRMDELIRTPEETNEGKEGSDS